jgi:hypothetical protein
MTPVVTSVKSPFTSKVNWILLATALLDVANQALPIVPAAYQSQTGVYITLAGVVLGIITKTFYTTSISSASVPSNAPVSTVTHDEHEQTEALNILQLKH